MGAWIHNFYVLPKHTQHKILSWEGLVGWFRLGREFCSKPDKWKKDLGTFPPFFLKERENKQSWKAEHAFAAKYMWAQAKESSPRARWNRITRFLKMWKQHLYNDVCKGDSTEGVSFKWVKLNKNMCKNTSDIKIQNLLVANILLNFVF